MDCVLHIPFCQLLHFQNARSMRIIVNGILVFSKSLAINETNSSFLHLYCEADNRWGQFLSKAG